MDAVQGSPQALQAVTLFLFPGFLFMFLFFYQIPDRKKSDFIIVTISVMASLALNAVTHGLYLLVSFLFNLPLPSQENTVLTFWTSLLLAVAFSIILARFAQSENTFFKTINKRLFKVDSYLFGTIWNAYLKMQPDSYVKVTLEDGRSYVGKLGRVSNDTNDQHQALELLKPFIYDSERRRVNRITETESMLLRGDAIFAIEKITDENAKILYKL